MPASELNRRSGSTNRELRRLPGNVSAMRQITLPLIVVVVVSIAGTGFAQTKVSNQQPSYEGQQVGSVDLTANPHIDTEPFRHLLMQEAGEPFSGEKVRVSIAALERTGAFSKVELKVQPDPSGLKLTFVLEPSYYIGILSFPGAIKTFTYARLLQVANLTDETVYQPSEIAASEAALVNFFHEHGFFEAKVHADVQLDDKNQLANPVFHVELGKHARIGKVEVRGSTPEENRRLERTMRTLRARFTGALLKSGKSYSPTRIKAATALLKKALAKEHHPASKITLPPPEYHTDTRRADIAINVDTGPEILIRVAGAKLSWVPFLSGRQQKKLIPIYEEASVDPDLVEEGQRNLLNYFQQKGYFDAKVNTNFQQQNGKTLLVYQIDKGRKHTVREIAFSGKHHFDTGDLMNQVVLKKKQLITHGRFSDKLLRTSVTNLENFYKDNGFEDVKVTPEVVDREPSLYVTFNIAEGDRPTRWILLTRWSRTSRYVSARSFTWARSAHGCRSSSRT